jgi:hypothetical protein
MPRLSLEQTRDIETEIETAMSTWLDAHSYELGEIVRDAIGRSFSGWLDRARRELMS